MAGEAGGDAKYGRIYTEQDVRRLLGAEMGVADDVVDDVLATFDARASAQFPPTEPLFVIRGKDEAAPDGIERYAEAASDAGASDRFVQGCARQVQRFEEWQEENGDAVKVPD